MSDDIIDIFSGLPVEGATKIHPPLPAPPKPKQPYKAFETGERMQHSLMVTNSFGTVRLFSYTYLSEVFFRRSYHHLDLFYHNKGAGMVAMVYGPNLEVLLEPLQDRKLRAIHSFNKGVHLRPDAGEPVITEVKTASLKAYYDMVAKQLQKPAG